MDRELFEGRMTDLGDLCEQATSPDNALATPYNLGRANGLRLALAVMTGQRPRYVDPPRYFSDKDAYTFKDYQHDAAKTAVYPEEIGLLYLALKLSGEAGEVGELVAKAYRDDDGIISKERLAKLEKELGDVLWYLSELCRKLGLSLPNVAHVNREKLTDRAERGVIKGSGSDR